MFKIYKAVQTVVKDPSLVGKAIVTQFKTQVEDLDRSLEHGDYFRAGQGLGEMGVDLAATLSAGYGLAKTGFEVTKTGIKVASKLSIRALDLAVSSRKPRVNTSKLSNTSNSIPSLSSIDTKVHISDDKAGHIFRNRPGHISDTPENRTLLIDIAQDLSTRQGIDKHGTAWHSQIRNDGTQIWVQVRENKIRNGGINNPPKSWNAQTGYSASHKPTKGPTNK